MAEVLMAARSREIQANGETEEIVDIRLSEVLSALTYALDMTEGQAQGHAIRTCMTGMSIADHLELSSEERSALFYALLLKDLGCSSNAAKVTYLFGGDDHTIKHRLKTIDWSNLLQSARYAIRNAAEGQSVFKRLRTIVFLGLKNTAAARDLMQTRCERGADIARSLGFPEATARAILDLDEHWNGKGHPKGLRREQISLPGRILGLAQTIEVFYSTQGSAAAVRVVQKRRGTWFEPHLCDLFLEKVASDTFWEKLRSPDLITEIGAYEPGDRVLHADQQMLDRIAEAFARVVDAKSPYTFKHSSRVRDIVLGMAEEIRIPHGDRRTLSRAALLHDIGKLGVSNMILDKKGALTPEEWEAVRKHPAYTQQILERVNGFSQLAELAAAHHERLDGEGYHRRVTGDALTLPARLLAVADQYEALTAKRPYRTALVPHDALQVLALQVGTGIDEKAYEALRKIVMNNLVSPAEESVRT
ncbi:MAG: HD-GYP domain-containing protein [Anaerolineales bacterium]